MATKRKPTQLEAAKRGEATREMERVAKDEGIPLRDVVEKVGAGRIVIPANHNHQGLEAKGVGMELRTKVNANIGNSTICSGIENELDKLRTAIKYGADAVMDLSTGGDLDKIRIAIINESPVPVGTVPVYEAAREVDGKGEELDPRRLLDIIEKQGRQGVDFITVHCGILRDHLPLAEKRLMGIVSRGGSLMAAWMKKHGKENPLYQNFDDLLDIARTYDMTLSLGDGLRPGCLEDSSDEAQFAELEVLGSLVERSRKAGVQAMVEGPGHIPINEIEMNIKKQIEICDSAPFYVLGPVVTDVAPGYDHITSAIGGALAAYFGAAMLCYVTPKEHLGLPGVEDVRQGVVAARIAAHAGDIARNVKGSREWDRKMSMARFAFDWERQFSLSMDPERAREFKMVTEDEEEERYCTMCGPEFCAMKITKEKVLEEDKEKREDSN